MKDLIFRSLLIIITLTVMDSTLSNTMMILSWPLVVYIAFKLSWAKVKFCYKHPVESFRYLFPHSVEPDTLVINKLGTTAKITFKYLGHHHSLLVPYDLSKGATMSHLKYTLVDDLGNKHLWHHFAGVPILVSPLSLGYKQLIIEDQLNDTIKTYTGEQIVGYPE